MPTLEQTAQARRHAESSAEPQQDQPPRGVKSALTRVVLGILTTLVSINIWTGGPLVALWVGSKVQQSIGSLSMAAVGATIGVLIVVTYVLYKILAWLHVRYNAALGRTMPRHQAAWLKPMSGERRALQTSRPLSAVERIVVVSVVIACEAFVVWFLFFAHYTLAA